MCWSRNGYLQAEFKFVHNLLHSFSHKHLWIHHVSFRKWVKKNGRLGFKYEFKTEGKVKQNHYFRHEAMTFQVTETEESHNCLHQELTCLKNKSIFTTKRVKKIILKK